MPPFDPRQLPFLTRDMLAFGHSASLQIILQLVATGTETIEVRGMTKEGPFTFSITPIGDSSLETFTLGIPDIPISMSVIVNPSALSAVVNHATLHLAIDGNRLALLAQGVITNLYGIAWPYQLNSTGAQHDGPTEVIQFVDPAVATNFETTVPTHQEWEVLGITASLDTDANAANRVVSFTLGQNALPNITRIGETNITANQVVTVIGVVGGTTGVITAAALHEIGLPLHIRLPRGETIQVNATNKQAGDQIQDVKMLIRRRFHLSDD